VGGGKLCCIRGVRRVTFLDHRKLRTLLLEQEFFEVQQARKSGPKGTSNTRKEGRTTRQREKEAARDRICENLEHRWTNLAMLGLGFWSHVVRVLTLFAV